MRTALNELHKNNIISDTKIKESILNMSEQNILKCGYFNDVILLIDEADLIIDPLISEMIKPTSEKILLDKNNYNILIDILFRALIFDSSESIKINMTKNIIDINKDYIYFAKYVNFIKSNKYKTKYTDKIVQHNKLFDYVYNCNELINTVSDLVNRKDFGFANEDDEIITPFEYSETPIHGSEFNDILLNLMLTIKSYINDGKLSIIKLIKFMKFVISELEKINPKMRKGNKFYKFVDNLFLKYSLPNILYLFNVSLEKSQTELINKLKKNNLYENIQKMCMDKSLIIEYCKEILYKHIYYYNTQLNINGIDIVNSNIFNYINGFTGTPENRFTLLDINPVNILPKNQSSIISEKEAYDKNCNIINYNISNFDIKILNENTIYIDFILNNISDRYNVIIDVGATFINIKFNDLLTKLFNKFTKINRIIYFDKNDKIYTINRTNIYIIHIWDYSIFNDDLIFYDNSHITGIDLILPNNFIGFIPIRQNTRYRDFIQGLYRMRKIGSTHTADIMIMPNILNNLDKFNLSNIITNNNTNISKLNIKSILEINENNYFQDQLFYLNIQKYRQIKTIYKLYNLEPNPFIIQNNLVKLANSYEEYNNKLTLEINNIYTSFVDNHEKFINSIITKDIKNIKKLKESIIDYLEGTNFIKNLSIQLQLQKELEYQIEINVQIKKDTKKYISYPYENFNALYGYNFKPEKYNDYFKLEQIENNIEKKEYIKRKLKINYVFEIQNIKYKLCFSSTLLKTNTAQYTLNGLFTGDSIKYNFLYCLMIVIETGDGYIIKIGTVLEIINIVKYYNDKYVIFDLFGNIINMNKFDLHTNILSVIKLIKFILFCIDINYEHVILNYNNILKIEDIMYLLNDKKNINNIYKMINILCNNSDENIRTLFNIKYLDYRICTIIIIGLLKQISSLNNNLTGFIDTHINNNTVITKTYYNNEYNKLVDYIINNLDCITKIKKDPILKTINECENISDLLQNLQQIQNCIYTYVITDKYWETKKKIKQKCDNRDNLILLHKIIWISMSIKNFKNIKNEIYNFLNTLYSDRNNIIQNKISINLLTSSNELFSDYL